MNRRRRVLEAARLAGAIAVELQALVQHYEDNLSLLTYPGAELISIRSPGAMFRANTNRLVGLIGERSLNALAAVYANHERIEALIKLYVKPKQPRRNSGDIYEIYRQRVHERTKIGRQLAETALGSITATWPLVKSEQADPNTAELEHSEGALVPWQEDDFMSASSDPL